MDKLNQTLKQLFGRDYMTELVKRSTKLSYAQFYYVLKQDGKDKDDKVISEVNRLIAIRKAELKKMIA